MCVSVCVCVCVRARLFSLRNKTKIIITLAKSLKSIELHDNLSLALRNNNSDHFFPFIDI